MEAKKAAEKKAIGDLREALVKIRVRDALSSGGFGIIGNDEKVDTQKVMSYMHSRVGEIKSKVNALSEIELRVVAIGTIIVELPVIEERKLVKVLDIMDAEDEEHIAFREFSPGTVTDYGRFTPRLLGNMIRGLPPMSVVKLNKMLEVIDERSVKEGHEELLKKDRRDTCRIH